MVRLINEKADYEIDSGDISKFSGPAQRDQTDAARIGEFFLRSIGNRASAKWRAAQNRAGLERARKSSRPVFAPSSGVEKLTIGRILKDD